MRFDDSLDTVLRAERTTPGGVQAAWRQLVDLLGRRRVPDEKAAVAHLRQILPQVPLATRAASARGLERADPPPSLVELLALDLQPVSAPVLRIARMAAAEWLTLLPRLSPPARAVLRHRRDLPDDVVRALAQFGSVDFLIEPFPQAADVASTTKTLDPVCPADPEPPEHAADEPTGPFRIADVVARIEAFRADRKAFAPSPRRETPADSFRFETDATGTIRWIDGIAREPLIGLSLDPAVPAVTARLDGICAGAFRRRARFADARLVIGGDSEAKGSWRVSAIPAFDRISGRFTGYRGTARRPRADQQAEPRPLLPGDPASLRELLHELRTPTTAIIGFAEMIESELLGPASGESRARAGTIRDEMRALLGAVDDLEIAARLESGALTLRPAPVALTALFRHLEEELRALLEWRGATLRLPLALPPDAALAADPRAATRLVTRLTAALAATAGAGETLALTAERQGANWHLSIARPAALAGLSGEAMLVADDDGDDPALLGLGFALRLARRLAGELGGKLVLHSAAIALILPAAVTEGHDAVYQRP